MNICVFCSANDVDKKYANPAKELAEALGARGDTLLWGGSDVGLMKVVADGVQQKGGKLVGITMELFEEFARKNADEMIVVKTLAERKSLLLDRADVIVVLPGGLGTFDEFTETVELKRHGTHSADIFVLNTDNFYEGLRLQLERMQSEGFLPVAELGQELTSGYAQWVSLFDTPKELLAALPKDSTRPPTV